MLRSQKYHQEHHTGLLTPEKQQCFLTSLHLCTKTAQLDLADWLLNVGEGNINGFGLEFFIESASSEIAETIHDVKKSWQFQLLYTVSQLAAGATIPRNQPFLNRS